MGGKRIYGFREGDRSEYLAQYLLSRFSFVYPFPRQEDFGVGDFLCILGRVENKLVYPGDGFYVQVKSNETDIIFDKDTTNWISNNMDLPLLICIINKKKSYLKIYSTSKIWVGLFMLHSPDSVTLKLNEGTNDQTVQRIDNSRDLVVPIGNPIMSMSLDEVEKNPNQCLDILRPWLLLDKLNIARRSIGRIYCSGYLNWKPNGNPQGWYNQYTFGPGYKKVEEDLAQILTALAFNYHHNKDRDGLKAVIQLMKKFPELLDEKGNDFVSEKVVIE